jgi:hypothetical protein
MIIKEIIRNIPENREDSSERYRIQYKDKNEFDLLVVTINRLKTNEVQTFGFSSKELSNKDSIFFTTTIEKDKLMVIWQWINEN